MLVRSAASLGCSTGRPRLRTVALASRDTRACNRLSPMAGELVVVIVPAALADAARDQMENKDTVVFADAEVLRALEAISTRRPGKVLLERRFAKTSRGNALVNRLRADPSLAQVQIDTMDYTPEPALAAPRQTPSVTVVEDTPPAPAAPAAPPTPAPAPAPAAAPAPAPPPAPVAQPAPLDKWGTRRAARVRVEDGLSAIVDGATVSVVDLSVFGAQVLSPAVLKPNQRLRFSLTDQSGAVRCNAVVAWATFELPRAGRPGPHYRAGLAFLDAEADSVTAFVDRHRRPA